MSQCDICGFPQRDGQCYIPEFSAASPRATRRLREPVTEQLSNFRPIGDVLAEVIKGEGAVTELERARIVQERKESWQRDIERLRRREQRGERVSRVG